MIAAMAMLTSGQVACRWTFAAGDGFWTNAANWDVGFVPTLANDTANWTGYTITLDAPGEVARWWSRHPSGNTLIITAGGSLTSASDVTLNEFSGEGLLNSAMLVDGGSLTVATNLAVSGQSTSQGSGTLTMNSGSINVGQNLLIGTQGLGLGVTGEVTINSGSVAVSNQTILGGGNLASDEGTLNLYGGIYTESFPASTNPVGFEIGDGPGSGTVNLYGGTLVNNHALLMEPDEANDAGTALINMAGGEWWQLGTNVVIQDESTLNFSGGTFYWSGDQVAAFSALVAGGNVTYEQGLTNMLTGSWNASWSNSVTLDYGYWSKTYGSALFADYNDVTNGFTTVWAYNLSPAVPPAVSDSNALTHTFNDAGGDLLWTTPGNWDALSVPTAEDTALHNAVGSVLVVADPAAVNTLGIGSDLTSTVAVVTYGTLSVGGNVDVGNYGSTGIGKLLVDGGDVDIGGTLDLAIFGAGRKGLCEINSGTMTVGNATTLGGWDIGADGELTINGGTFEQTGNVLRIGRAGNGTVIVNDGVLDIVSGTWDPLRIADNGSGEGTLIVNGGWAETPGMQMEFESGAGIGRIYLNGGTFRIGGTFDAAFRMGGGSQMIFDQGVFRQGGNRLSLISSYVTSGHITWTNGMDTMLFETPDLAWTNGLSTLNAIVDSGETYVWAYQIPEPEDPPVMSIAVGAGSVDVTAENMGLSKSYELQSTTTLDTPSWTPVGSTSGVQQATWNLPATESAQFFQVEEQ
jgi:hypothetical protein